MSKASEGSRPNILFILTDQQIADTLSMYGGELCRTPNLDRLAERGTVFDRAYTVCPVCSPARASIQTGLYPFKHGIMTNIYTPGCAVHELPDSDRLLSRQLTRLGYSAGFTGKWHLGFEADKSQSPEFSAFHRDQMEWPEAAIRDGALPSTRGYEAEDFAGHGDGGYGYAAFQDYLKQNGRSFSLKHPPKICEGLGYLGEITTGEASTIEHYITELTMNRLRTFSDREQPFFMMANYWGPHAPHFVPTAWLEPYRNLEIPPWPNWSIDPEKFPSIHWHNRSTRNTWADFEENIRYALAHTAFIDHQVGKLIQQLEENGDLENTVVIFSSDHGDSLGRHAGMVNKGLSMFEETCRIPLCIAGPEIPIGRCQRFSTNVDLYSTILELAGLPRGEAERHGHSLLPAMNGTAKTDGQDIAVSTCSGIGSVVFTQRMLRKGPWKYVFNAGDKDELYNLEEDPWETTNLVHAQDHALHLSEMQDALDAWMERIGDNDVLRGFRALRRRVGSVHSR